MLGKTDKHPPFGATPADDALKETLSMNDHRSSTSLSSFQNHENKEQQQKQGGNMIAFFNVVCVVAGTGALSLPYALKQGGWIGLLILGLSWLFSIYTGIILIRCLYHNGQTRLSSYQEVAKAAFGVIGGWIAFFFTAVTLIGVPVLYLLLAGQNLHALCKGTSGELTFPIWVIICAAVVGIPFVFFKSLKEVGVLSCFGTLTTVVVVFIVLGVSVTNMPDRSLIHHDPVIWNMFPIALSSISFSFGGNPIYAHIEASMRRPQDWSKVVGAGLTMCVILYFLTAIPGYYVYGDTVVSPIYDNLPDGGPKTASTIIITLHVLLATPLLLTSFSLDLEKLLRITSPRWSWGMQWTQRIALRLVLMIVVVVIAIFVPYFGDFLSLLGAFANCALIFIFPVLCYLKLTGVRNKPFYELIVCFFTVLLGLVGLIFGTISACQALHQDFTSQSH